MLFMIWHLSTLFLPSHYTLYLCPLVLLYTLPNNFPLYHCHFLSSKYFILLLCPLVLFLPINNNKNDLNSLNYLIKSNFVGHLSHLFLLTSNSNHPLTHQHIIQVCISHHHILLFLYTKIYNQRKKHNLAVTPII
jgi:hypothetical protein